MKDGGPAFPAPYKNDPYVVGMSLRDYFAGQALTGAMVAEGWTASQTAEKCYEVADAMLAARGDK